MHNYKPNTTKAGWLILSLAVLLWLAGLLTATFWDLQIDQKLYDPQNGFGIIMEVVGWYPLLVPTLMLAFYYGTASKNTPVSIPLRVFWWVGVFLCSGSMFGYCCRKLLQRGWIDGISDYRTYFWLAGNLLFAVLVGVFVWKASPKIRRCIRFIGIAGAVLAAENLIVITVIKQIWQRTRFATLMEAGSLTDFTVWYSPFGNGGESFPSGHTANAVSMLLLVALCDVCPKLRKYRVVMYGVAWGYIAAMAFSRIILGAHFLSDVLVGSAIVGILFFLMRRQTWYKKAVAKAQTPSLN